MWKLQYHIDPQKVKTPAKVLAIKYKFKVGDLVRVSFQRRQFQKEYDERWSRELFVVNQRFIAGGIPQYRLKDYAGEIVTGTFYQNQINKAHEQDTYLSASYSKTRKYKTVLDPVEGLATQIRYVD